MIKRLTSTTERQRSWLKSKGIDVNHILNQAKRYDMQVLWVSEDRHHLEKIDRCTLLHMRNKRRADEPQRVGDVDTVELMPGCRP